MQTELDTSVAQAITRVASAELLCLQLRQERTSHIQALRDTHHDLNCLAKSVAGAGVNMKTSCGDVLTSFGCTNSSLWTASSWNARRLNLRRRTKDSSSNRNHIISTAFSRNSRPVLVRHRVRWGLMPVRRTVNCRHSPPHALRNDLNWYRRIVILYSRPLLCSTKCIPCFLFYVFRMYVISRYLLVVLRFRYYWSVFTPLLRLPLLRRS